MANISFNIFLPVVICTAIISGSVVYLLKPNNSDEILRLTEKEPASVNVEKEQPSQIKFLEEKALRVPREAENIYVDVSEEVTKVDGERIAPAEGDDLTQQFEVSAEEEEYYSVLTEKVKAYQKLRSESEGNLKKYNVLVEKWQNENTELLERIEMLKEQVAVEVANNQNTQDHE